MIFKDCSFCFSKIENEEKNNLKNLIIENGGNCFKKMSNEVTHLITNQVGSEKYLTAKILDLIIVKKEWIIECIKEKKYIPIETFQLKAFEGVILSVSQLKKDER